MVRILTNVHHALHQSHYQTEVASAQMDSTWTGQHAEDAQIHHALRALVQALISATLAQTAFTCQATNVSNVMITAKHAMVQTQISAPHAKIRRA